MRPRSDRTTVVVITHNYGRYLPCALDSVLGQRTVPQLLVMDDASEDDTDRVMATYAGHLRYWRSPLNQGLARMRNTAAGMADTDWIVYLDADDWLDAEFIARAEARLEADAPVDALTTDMRVLRDGRAPFTVRSRVPAHWDDLLVRNTVLQTSVLRRALVGRLGGYDPALLFEDWDFWIRLLKAGYAIDRLPGVHVFRREHGLNKSKTCDEREGVRQIRAKHPPP
jgi:glycosyltransferase involved in cell wall biosynthesis